MECCEVVVQDYIISDEHKMTKVSSSYVPEEILA